MPALLKLYARERELYVEVLQLSREQAAMIRRGESLAAVRRILAAKRDRLDEVARLERLLAAPRRSWQGRHRGERLPAAADLQQVLQDLGGLIEEILMAEAENDRLFLEMARGAL
ncbi:MAG: hypothetical protein IPH09_02260 [bacterium]|nr:hypothetical protein [bacterium]MBK9303266.1 hypothetical protein [bacterium]